MPKSKQAQETKPSIGETRVADLADEANDIIGEMNKVDRAAVAAGADSCLHEIHSELQDQLHTVLNCVSFAEAKTQREIGVLAMMIISHIEDADRPKDMRLIRRCANRILDALPEAGAYPHLLKFMCREKPSIIPAKN